MDATKRQDLLNHGFTEADIAEFEKSESQETKQSAQPATNPGDVSVPFDPNAVNTTIAPENTNSQNASEALMGLNTIVSSPIAHAIEGGALGLYGVNKIANAISNRAPPGAPPAGPVAPPQAPTTFTGGANTAFDKALSKPYNPSSPTYQGPSATSTGKTFSPQAQQYLQAEAAHRAEQMAAQQALANPNAQNFLQRMAAMGAKYAGPASAAAMVGTNLYGTGQDEIDILKAAEAKRRAAGWRPLNER